MSIGDLVILKEYSDDKHICLWGLGIVVTRAWNSEGFWESLVWFDGIEEHVLCDDIDLKKVA